MTEPGHFEGEDQHGWSPDQPETGDKTAAEAADKAFDGEAGAPGPGRDISDEERSGVGPTDTEAQSPLDVGTSTRRSAEDIAAGDDEEGRTTEGTKGETERPYGTSSAEDATGVDPQ
jgi:hypothetical protein